MGFERIEWVLEGWIPKHEVSLLSANTGMGKSRFLLKLACDLIKTHDTVIIYTSNEMIRDRHCHPFLTYEELKETQKSNSYMSLQNLSRGLSHV